MGLPQVVPSCLPDVPRDLRRGSDESGAEDGSPGSLVASSSPNDRRSAQTSAPQVSFRMKKQGDD